MKDFSEDKFLSSNVERTFAFEIKVKNNKKSAVNIIVEDQIPISKNEDIIVKLIESPGAIFDAVSGKLKWILDVDGGKSVSRKLVYSVKYPGINRCKDYNDLVTLNDLRQAEAKHLNLGIETLRLVQS